MNEMQILAKKMRELAMCDYILMNGGDMHISRELWLSIADIIDRVDVKAEKKEIRDCFQPPKLEPWQKRLRIEYKQVKKRHDMLLKCIKHYYDGTLNFKADIALMERQNLAMYTYIKCLEERMRKSGMEV